MTNGICGAAAPISVKPAGYVCDLESGHAGWHAVHIDHQNGHYTKLSWNMPSRLGTQLHRPPRPNVVKECATAYKAGFAEVYGGGAEWSDHLEPERIGGIRATLRRFCELLRERGVQLPELPELEER